MLDGSAGAPGGGGPHNDGPDTPGEDGLWDGVGTPPAPSCPGRTLRLLHPPLATRPTCTAPTARNTRSSLPLLFNNSPAQDDAEYPELVAENGPGTYGGGLDAAYNNLGDRRAVARFDAANPDITASASTGPYQIQAFSPMRLRPTPPWPVSPAAVHRTRGPARTSATPRLSTRSRTRNIMRTATTVRRSPVTTAASLAPLAPTPSAIDTGAEFPGWGGNDHRDSKTGHVAGSLRC